MYGKAPPPPRPTTVGATYNLTATGEHIEPLPRINIGIEGQRITALLDSAATHNFIRPGLVKQPVERTATTTSIALAAASTDCHVQDEVATNVEIQGEMHRARFLTIPDLREKVILGQPWLRNQRASLDFQTEHVVLGNDPPLIVPWIREDTTRLNDAPPLKAVAPAPLPVPASTDDGPSNVTTETPSLTPLPVPAKTDDGLSNFTTEARPDTPVPTTAEPTEPEPHPAPATPGPAPVLITTEESAKKGSSSGKTTDTRLQAVSKTFRHLAVQSGPTTTMGPNVKKPNCPPQVLSRQPETEVPREKPPPRPGNRPTASQQKNEQVSHQIFDPGGYSPPEPLTDPSCASSDNGQEDDPGEGPSHRLDNRQPDNEFPTDDSSSDGS